MGLKSSHCCPNKKDVNVWDDVSGCLKGSDHAAEKLWTQQASRGDEGRVHKETGT